MLTNADTQVWLEKVVFKVDELPAPPPGKGALSAEEVPSQCTRRPSSKVLASLAQKYKY